MSSEKMPIGCKWAYQCKEGAIVALEMEIAQGVVRVFSDSHSALCLVQDLVYHARTKHIDIRYHRIRKLVEDGELELAKVYTKENTVDTLTKELPWDSFFRVEH